METKHLQIENHHTLFPTDLVTIRKEAFWTYSFLLFVGYFFFFFLIMASSFVALFKVNSYTKTVSVGL